MKNKSLYLSLCKEVDGILVRSGIKKICFECSKCINDNRSREVKNLTNSNGCCYGCKYLSEKGCTTKSLACKLWVCQSMLLNWIVDKKDQVRWNEIIEIMKKKGWTEYRKGVEDYFR